MLKLFRRLATRPTYIYRRSLDLQKGGSAMEQKVVLDWKSVVALGAAASLLVLAIRMPESAIGNAYCQLVSAVSNGLAIAETSVC